MPRGAADRLDQRAFRAQEAFLVRVQDGHQRHLGKVEALAQQVDAHQHVEFAQAQIADDLDPFDGVDVGVQIAHLDPVLVQIVGQVLGHALGQGRDQHAFALFHPQIDFRQQIVHLGSRRPHLDHRVDQAGGTHDLLDHLTRVRVLVVGRRGGNKNRLRQQLFEFVEAQRPVVQRTRQPETVVDQIFLPRTVALVHATDLRNRDVRFIDEHQCIARQVVDQGGRRLARLRPDRWRE